MLRKYMRKSKGKWIVVGLSSVALSLSLQVVNAEELDQVDNNVQKQASGQTVEELVSAEKAALSTDELPANLDDLAVEPIEVSELENKEVDENERLKALSDAESEAEEDVENISAEKTSEEINQETISAIALPVMMSTAQSQSQSQTHVVKSGEYLYLIGQRYGVTVQQIKEWNKLTSNYIYSGDQLVVSKPSVKPVEPSEPDKVVVDETPVTTAAKYYTVRPGDYLWKIANEHDLTVNQLKVWNNLTSNYIYSGDRFLVTDPKVVKPDPKPEVKPDPKPEVKPDPKPTVSLYKVKTGDYLWKIATQYGITVNQLKAWNKLTSNYIYSGDQLFVSDPSKEVEPTKPEPETPTPSPEKEPEKTPEQEAKPAAIYYSVKSGDYLWKIATQYGITVNQLKSWNKLPSNYIYTGDRLIVTDPNKTQTESKEPGQTESTKPGDVLSGTHQAVQAVLNQYKNSPIHVFYESLLEDDLRTASLSGDVAMYGASVPKVVLIAYTLEQIEKGNLSWETPLKYNSAIYNYSESYAWGGSGTIQYENYLNKSYTLKDVVYRTIVDSDNLGSNMLLHYVGYRDKADFNRFTKEVYGAPKYTRTMTPREINKVMTYIYDHPQQYAMNTLDKTIYDNTKLDTVSANVFQKIGAWWPYYNHSTAIVDSSRPYVLTVLTDYWSDSSIATLAKKIFTAVMS